MVSEGAVDARWSPADLSDEARSYLLAEARLRVQEQLSFMDSQDVRTRTAFIISVLLVSAVGIIGDVRIDAHPLAILTMIAFVTSVITWIFSWLAFRAVIVETGINVAALAQDYADASRRDLEDAVLGALISDFQDNRAVIANKGRWLRSALYALGLQLLLLVATVFASTV